MTSVMRLPGSAQFKGSEEMASQSKHEWVNFTRGRIKLLGCACCGQMQLPSNKEEECTQTSLTLSPLFRNGFRSEKAMFGRAA